MHQVVCLRHYPMDIELNILLAVKKEKNLNLNTGDVFSWPFAGIFGVFYKRLSNGCHKRTAKPLYKKEMRF